MDFLQLQVSKLVHNGAPHEGSHPHILNSFPLTCAARAHYQAPFFPLSVVPGMETQACTLSEHFTTELYPSPASLKLWKSEGYRKGSLSFRQ